MSGTGSLWYPVTIKCPHCFPKVILKSGSEQNLCDLSSLFLVNQIPKSTLPSSTVNNSVKICIGTLQRFRPGALGYLKLRRNDPAEIDHSGHSP